MESGRAQRAGEYNAADEQMLRTLGALAGHLLLQAEGAARILTPTPSPTLDPHPSPHRDPPPSPPPRP